MKFEVNISKKYFFVILSSILILAGAFVVYAFGSGQAPNILGHSSEEIQITVNGTNMSLQNAINQGRLRGPDYDSGWIDTWAWSGNVHTIPHSLGATPTFFMVQLKTKNTALGYGVGTVINLASVYDRNWDAGNAGISTYMTSTNVGISRRPNPSNVLVSGPTNEATVTSTDFSIRYLVWK